MSVSIKNLTRQHLKVEVGSVFSEIAAAVLPEWDISLVFVGSKKALELNKKLRGKDYIPNVLSYKLGEKNGEIFICPSEASKQAPLFRSYTLHLTPVFVYPRSTPHKGHGAWCYYGEMRTKTPDQICLDA